MQICNECLRGLTIGRNEVCLKCTGTGFEIPVAETPKETVVSKAVKAVAKKVKKK